MSEKLSSKVLGCTGQGPEPNQELLVKLYAHTDKSNSFGIAQQEVLETYFESMNLAPHHLLSQEDASKAKNLQPILVTSSLVGALALQAEGYQPTHVFGQSIGEIAAFAVAGCISMTDAVRIARIRGEETGSTIDNLKEKTGMLAVRAKKQDIGKVWSNILSSVGSLKDADISLSNRNTGSGGVLAGPLSHLTELIKTLKENGVNAIPLSNIPAAFHTHFMRGSVEGFSERLSEFDINDPKPSIELWSPTSIDRVSNRESARKVLIDQLTNPVYLWQMQSILGESLLRSDCQKIEFAEAGLGSKITDDRNKGILLSTTQDTWGSELHTSQIDVPIRYYGRRPV